MKSSPYCSPPDSVIVMKQDYRDDVSVTSLSSTLTVDALPRKKIISSAPKQVEQTAEQTRPKLKRRSRCIVNFDEDANTYHSNETMSSEDCERLWYTVDDYAKFKQEIIRTVKTLLKHESRHPSPGSIGSLLETTYICCFECDEEDPNMLLPQNLQAAMKNQYRHNEMYLLGLERLIVKRIGKDRAELRKCLMEIVNDLQSKQDQLADPNVLAQNIARVSAEATRASRLFARHLGSAQVPYLLTCKPSAM